MEHPTTDQIRHLGEGTTRLELDGGAERIPDRQAEQTPPDPILAHAVIVFSVAPGRRPVGHGTQGTTFATSTAPASGTTRVHGSS